MRHPSARQTDQGQATWWTCHPPCIPPRKHRSALPTERQARNDGHAKGRDSRRQPSVGGASPPLRAAPRPRDTRCRSDPETAMKTAIATSDYFVMGETFINRHIAHLFGGETCVICGRANGEDPLGKPLFVRRAPLTAADKLRAPFAALSGAALHGTSRLPYG